MKTPFWKKIAVAILAIVVAVAGIFYFTPSTGNKTPTLFVNPAFAEYINSYTTGVIPSGSVLNIVFPQDMADSSKVGKETEDKFFEFSPALAGKTLWVDARTIQFHPEKRMSSGQVYSAKFRLSNLIKELPDDLKIFEYSFQVVPQNFEILVVNVKPSDNTDLRRALVEASFNTADYAESAQVEDAIKAFQNGRNLKVAWTHDDDGKGHHFIVEEVERREEAGTVQIRVNGHPIGVDRAQDLQVDIPALAEFKVMNIRVVQNPNQHLVLQFSDPVKENQNLQGLITLGDIASLEFDIHNNEIWIYPPLAQKGMHTVTISGGVRNALDVQLKTSVTQDVFFEQLKPEVRFIGKGSILPATEGLVVPFEAVNLRAVDVHILKVYEHNVLQFFQVNNIEGKNELRRVGKKVLRKSIPLESTGITDFGKWNRYTLDISRLIQTEPGAIYEITLTFRKSYSTYDCGGIEPEETLQFDQEEDLSEDADHFDRGYYDGYEEEYYYDEDFDWRQRENPCHSSYYTSNRFVSKNILASDLGLTVKHGGDGNTLVFITELKTAKPLQGVEVAFYDYQMQMVKSGTTDADGKVLVTSKETPFAIVARNGMQRGYLRLVNGEALQVSNFDVSGEVVQKGLKGFLYGERGVWRPGDSLYLTFILEDQRGQLPTNHPVVFELSNPQGQIANRIVRSSSENGFYSFVTSTAADAPTGNWLGRVKVGGAEFSQTLKIETVKPNRLKINLDFAKEKFTSPDISGTLNVKWLHGAPGRNLKAEFDATLLRQATSFPDFPNFNFDDPSREFTSESQVIFEGQTNAEGTAEVNAKLESAGTPSGLLNVVFRGKVYEESGNFSIDRFAIPYYPYSSFVGIRVPEGERYSGILYTDKDHRIDIATVNTDGKGISRQKLDVNLYKLEWRWWWDNSNRSLANFIEGNSSRVVRTQTLNTVNGKGSWTLNLQQAEYGRYFLRVCDPESGHCAGQIVYVDEPGWYSRARTTDARGGANLLSFSTDKTKYNIGEKILITIPGSANGRALVSVENGSRILQTHWLDTNQGETRFSIEATPEMSPNIYVQVSLMQPHAQTINDMPMRLYGVTSLQIDDPATHLEPVVSMPDVLVPGEPVSIRVSEKNERPMTFTVAMVDEGLLDLTRFKTPDAWRSFYAREALGVRTWDVFDYVMGAFGASLERHISIGGDDALAPGEVDPMANRFKPVVKYFGPFTVEGGSREITFTMPQYVGSVRTMVIGGFKGAYGKTEKVSTVKKPLMVLATLPRVLGSEEIVSLPVSLFAGDIKNGNVKVDVAVKGPVTIRGDRSKTLNLFPDSDTTLEFELDVKAGVGVATIEVNASAGTLRAKDVIEIQVRNPNLPVSRVDEFVLEGKKSTNTSFTPFGMEGTNSAVLEVSSMPPINLGSRMRYLLQYPHGCIEQTTSSVFPQLYLHQVKALTDTEKDIISRNVKAGIDRLRSFVQADGGFGYWPGPAESSDSWGTTYAGHFLVEAQSQGYYIPGDLLNRWKSFQKNKANGWRRNQDYYNSDLLQAYRLYTLALAGAPETGAMNRLREEQNLAPNAAWMLASAYAVSGQKEAARKLISQLPLTVKAYRELSYTYGSDVRDKALILETLVLLEDRVKSFEVLKEISASLGDEGQWMSTQETAICLKAVSLFAKNQKRGDLSFDYKFGDGKTVTATTALPLAQVQIPLAGLKEHSVRIENKSEGVLFARVITSGTPVRGQEADEVNNLAMEIRYTDTEGNTIDPTRLQQGTEFISEVTITHPGIRRSYENLALSQVFPSGWEINNLRLAGDEALIKTSGYTYQDIRDDRVLTYFDLASRQSKTFRVSLTATYAGDYYLPGVSCETMYDPGIYARKKGQTVNVSKATP